MRSYHHYLVGVARDLRKSSTPAEETLWKELRNRRLGGLKFRRQHRFDRYIVDFYCAELNLVVELEGEIHSDPDQIEYDGNRFSYLKTFGVRIMRVKNEDVMERMDRVKRWILDMAK